MSGGCDCKLLARLVVVLVGGSVGNNAPSMLRTTSLKETISVWGGGGGFEVRICRVKECEGEGIVGMASYREDLSAGFSSEKGV